MSWRYLEFLVVMHIHYIYVVSLCFALYIYISLYIYVLIHTFEIYTYIYIERERERASETEMESQREKERRIEIECYRRERLDVASVLAVWGVIEFSLSLHNAWIAICNFLIYEGLWALSLLFGTLFMVTGIWWHALG